MGTHLKYTLWLLKWACTGVEHPLASFHLLPGNVNAGQPLGTTENCGLLATAGHKCQRFSPGFSGSTEMMLRRLQSETRN